MEEKIKKAVAKALKNEFGEKYAIYDESVKQGIEKPCFFILTEKCVFERLLGMRASVSYTIKIEGQVKTREETEGIMCRMFYALNMISDENDRFLGRNMKFELKEKKGTFSVEYRSLIMFGEEKGEYMEHMERKDV